MASSDPRGLAKEVGTLRRLRPNLKNAVSHLVLSHDPSQRKLSESEWRQAIEVALEEHGATGAAMASWLHFDAQHQHAHVFFCRVLPNGEVVSDSHNFRKNETAARRIENLMNLQPPTPLPADEQIDDRQAVTNARRRAERNGTLDPAKIDVKAVRAALAEARDHAHFLQLLAEANIETGIDRRGVGRQIFGWRLRRIGAQEWIKASTLAKDLSWPKIAHRFPELEELQAPVLQAPEAPEQANSDQYARAPAPIRQMLREQHQQRHLVPAPKPEPTQTTRKSWDIDLAEVDRATRDLGPLSRAMALLGSACLKYTLSFLKTLIGWIKRLLEKLFGIGVRETQPASGQQAVQYEPFTIDAEAREVPDAEAATQLVNQVTAALHSKDAALLPNVEGRDQIAAALMADPGRQVDENALDEMFAPEVAAAATPPAAAPPAPPPAPPAAPPKTALVMFLEAAKTFSLTASLVRNAELKDIKYVDQQPAARAARDAAMTEHAELTEARRIWKSDNKVLSTLGADPLKFAARIEAAQKRVVAAEKSVEKAERQHGKFEKLWNATPTPPVPFELQDRHVAASENLKKSQQLLISKARLNLTILDGNPMLRQNRETFGALIRRAETQLAAFLIDPRTQTTVVKDVDEMIRNLTAEVNIERARLAPRPDVEDGQNLDEAGQHGFAAPGPR